MATALQQISEEKLFRLLVDSVDDYAIFMLDPHGFVATWNSGAEKIKGYTPAEIIGRHFSRFFTAEDQRSGLPARALATAKSTGRFETEGWRVRKNGAQFWASVVISVVRNEAGEPIGFAKVTRDISERRAAHQALVESERHFRMLVDGVVDYAIYMLDPSGVVTNWNAGAERIKGYSADEVIGQHFGLFYPREERAAGRPARSLETAAKEGRFEAEGWRIRKDGVRFWASVVIDAIRDEGGHLIGFAKITRDITDRRAAQQAVIESEREFRLFVNSVTDYALIVLDPNGVITSWNFGAERLNQYTREEALGRHFSGFYTDSDRAAGLPGRALEQARRDGRFEAEGWRVRKDGEVFWASVVIDAIRDEENRLVGFAKITRDITERRNAQLALQRSQAQLAMAQKMDALGQLTGGVAHDFNNLLMIISGHIRGIRKLLDGDPKGERAVDAIETAAQRGAKLTRQLLAFSRRQHLEPAVLDLGVAIEGTKDVLASSAGAAVRVAPSVMPGTWPIFVDQSEFELALINLVMNARDAMPEGGVVTITAENAVLKHGDVPDDVAGDFVAITVADTGGGIAPDILQRIFEPFFTTKGVDKGTGLGLSQVYGFARQSGGTAVAVSDLGLGTRMTLYLPRTDKAHTRAAGSAGGERSGKSFEGRGIVLLVEDNPEVAGATAPLLEELGYRVRIATDAGSALRIVNSDENISAVVSDIVMAGAMDGVTLARSLREQHPSLPVLLITGYSRAAETATGFPVLRKPFQIADLRDKLALAVGPRNGAAGNVVPLHPANTK